MKKMFEKIDPFLAVLILYLAGFLVCFGPATVDGERAAAAHDATCAQRYSCDGLVCPYVADGMFKALFWPLWLSYKVAGSQ